MGLGRAERDSNVTKNNSVGSVAIRLAQSSDDFELLTPLSLSLHAEGRYRNYPYNIERRNGLFAKVLEQPDRNALVLVVKSKNHNTLLMQFESGERNSHSISMEGGIQKECIKTSNGRIKNIKSTTDHSFFQFSRQSLVFIDDLGISPNRTKDF